jgi:hypothetical protein
MAQPAAELAATRVELSIAGGIAWITLDGPERRNALDRQAALDLVAACEQIDADPAVGAAVITGTGTAFCSGADTGILNGLRSARADEGYEGLDVLYSGFRRFAALTVPTVAAVNGAAVGAGLNLALAADLRVAAENALFMSGFAAIGLHPGGGHLHLLARAAGPTVAAAAGVFAQPMRWPPASPGPRSRWRSCVPPPPNWSAISPRTRRWPGPWPPTCTGPCSTGPTGSARSRSSGPGRCGPSPVRATGPEP